MVYYLKICIELLLSPPPPPPLPGAGGGCVLCLFFLFIFKTVESEIIPISKRLDM